MAAGPVDAFGFGYEPLVWCVPLGQVPCEGGRGTAASSVGRVTVALLSHRPVGEQRDYPLDELLT